jgi:ketosteroid isomerase-like protein
MATRSRVAPTGGLDGRTTTMSQDNENISIIKQGYEAFVSGDMDTLMSLWSDDIEWIQPGESTISGTFRGKDQLREFLMRFAEKSPTVTPKRYLADGDTVVVISEGTIGGESSDHVGVYTLRDGKGVRVQVFGDTAMMERHYGVKHAAAAT